MNSKFMKKVAALFILFFLISLNRSSSIIYAADCPEETCTWCKNAYWCVVDSGPMATECLECWVDCGSISGPEDLACGVSVDCNDCVNDACDTCGMPGSETIPAIPNDCPADCVSLIPAACTSCPDYVPVDPGPSETFCATICNSCNYQYCLDSTYGDNCAECLPYCTQITDCDINEGCTDICDTCRDQFCDAFPYAFEDEACVNCGLECNIMAANCEDLSPDPDDPADNTVYDMPDRPFNSEFLNAFLNFIDSIFIQPSEIAASVYNILLPIGVFIGIISIIMAGYMYMTSQGNPEKVKDANEKFTSAILGTLFIVLALVVLRIIIKNIIDPGLD